MKTFLERILHMFQEKATYPNQPTDGRSTANFSALAENRKLWADTGSRVFDAAKSFSHTTNGSSTVEEGKVLHSARQV